MDATAKKLMDNHIQKKIWMFVLLNHGAKCPDTPVTD